MGAAGRDHPNHQFWSGEKLAVLAQPLGETILADPDQIQRDVVLGRKDQAGTGFGTPSPVCKLQCIGAVVSSAQVSW